MNVQMKTYSDSDGNVYRVEQATNKKFVSVRINAGGNRKLLKLIAPSPTRDNAQRMLDALAEQSKWKEVTQ